MSRRACGLSGMDVDVYDVLPGRPNVVAVADGRDTGPS